MLLPLGRTACYPFNEPVRVTAAKHQAGWPAEEKAVVWGRWSHVPLPVVQQHKHQHQLHPLWRGPQHHRRAPPTSAPGPADQQYLQRRRRPSRHLEARRRCCPDNITQWQFCTGRSRHYCQKAAFWQCYGSQTVVGQGRHRPGCDPQKLYEERESGQAMQVR